ncbi:hypothetical protein SanaruYs_35090 [Chryseotalea sanaruensis]|uniref:Uncharacterized protein n=1 Tax=Chryseotalea sanaruensis TaxID=2482724 RepID=A0A401UED9_9BACT|nr:hypothetical protein [Chryseotalea sanaruensis]GCC53266.1 hypothetical protein SanaruYs_35090 [Chryseotalea sanaruensis]
MKSAELLNKTISLNQYQEHLEWDDENEASDEDVTCMGKCVISLGLGVILALGASLYFLLI